MKKYHHSLIIIGVVFATFLMPDVVSSQDLGVNLVDGAASQAGFSSAEETTFASNIGTGIRLALSFVGVIFTALTVYAGILWMTARGNESQVENAKKTLQNSLIGLIIAISSYAISGFVIQAFESGNQAGGGGTSDNTSSCCIICQGNGGLSCNFNDVERLGNTCSSSDPDEGFACVQPIPANGRCQTLRDDYCTDGGGNCKDRTKRSSERCADFL